MKCYIEICEKEATTTFRMKRYCEGHGDTVHFDYWRFDDDRDYEDCEEE